jgi:hypothetical protein
VVDVRIEGANQLGALSRRLKQAGRRDLQKELGKAVRGGAKPAVVATKQAILAVPVRGTRGGGARAREEHHAGRSKAGTEEKRRAKAQRQSGLRRTISGAIRLRVKTGSKTASVRIEVDGAKLPADQRSLPRHLDDPKGWRKPTFGHDPWTRQYGKPWFESTIRRYLPKIRADVLKALDDIAKKVEG